MASKRGWGDGGIYPRGENRWRLRYRVKGRRYSKVVEGSISDARKKLRELLDSADKGKHVAANKITLREWAKTWLAARSVNERTRERYTELLNNQVLPTLGDHKVQALRKSDFDSLYKSLAESGLSPRTVRHVHVVLAGCLKQAVDDDIVAVSPAAKVKAPKAEDSTVARVLEPGQLAALVDAFRGHPLHGIVATAAWTGARRNEVLALRWSDVNFAAKTLSITRSLEETRVKGRTTKDTKTGSKGRRTIAIDDGLVALLRDIQKTHQRLIAGLPDDAGADLSLIRLPDASLIFPTPGDDLLVLRDARAVTRTFERKAASLGFGKLRFHDLRGSHETALLDAGVSPHVVAARCGHDAAMLMRAYAKRTAASDARAATIIGEIARNVTATS